MEFLAFLFVSLVVVISSSLIVERVFDEEDK